MRLFVCSCLLALIVSYYPSHGQAAGSWDSAKQKLQDMAFDSQSCDSVWSAVWPWAAKREPEALFQLFVLIYQFGLVFPGHSDDVLMRSRTALTLITNAAVGDKKYLKTLLDAWPQSGAIVYANGEEIRKCFKEGRNPKDCLNKAVENHLIPKFEDFVTEVELAASLNVKAYCTFPRTNENRGRIRRNPD